MSDLHERAADLLLTGVESIGEKDLKWLQQHLSECVQCERFAETVQFTTAIIRSQPHPASDALVARTKALVHLRRDELRERKAQIIPMWTSCALAVAISFLTTRYLWQFCAWLGDTTAMPRLIWESIFAMAWFFPAALTAALILALRPAAREQTPQSEALNG